MANHVYSYFEITFKSEEDCNNFAEWIGLDPKDENITWGERIEACCNIMMDNLYPDKEDTREWWLDNVGAKWMYFDDVDRSTDSSIIINMTSAWDFPEGLFFRLSDFLRERYQGVTMQVTFDYFHPDFDELDEYKDEDDCWTEEFYEEMSNIKDELLQDVLAFIQQDLEKE